MTRRQCKACPWKTSTDPYDIPGGYRERQHVALSSTIAEPAALPTGALRLMACHETKRGKELPCVGWLAQQLGPGNNIGLRLAVMGGRVSADFELVGPQHERLEETLPRSTKSIKTRNAPVAPSKADKTPRPAPQPEASSLASEAHSAVPAKKRTLAQLALMRKSRGTLAPPTRRQPAAVMPELSATERLHERLEARQLQRRWEANQLTAPHRGNHH